MPATRTVLNLIETLKGVKQSPNLEETIAAASDAVLRQVYRQIRQARADVTRYNKMEGIKTYTVFLPATRSQAIRLLEYDIHVPVSQHHGSVESVWQAKSSGEPNADTPLGGVLARRSLTSKQAMALYDWLQNITNGKYP